MLHLSWRAIEYIGLAAVGASAFIPGAAFADYRRVAVGFFAILWLLILSGHPKTTGEVVASVVNLIIAAGIFWFIFPRLKKIFHHILEKR